MYFVFSAGIRKQLLLELDSRYASPLDLRKSRGAVSRARFTTFYLRQLQRVAISGMDARDGCAIFCREIRPASFEARFYRRCKDGGNKFIIRLKNVRLNKTKGNPDIVVNRVTNTLNFFPDNIPLSSLTLSPFNATCKLFVDKNPDLFLTENQILLISQSRKLTRLKISLPLTFTSVFSALRSFLLLNFKELVCITCITLGQIHRCLTKCKHLSVALRAVLLCDMEGVSGVTY